MGHVDLLPASGENLPVDCVNSGSAKNLFS